MKAISYPYTLTSFGVTTSTTNQSKIYTDRVLTLLSSAIGSRPMQPSYGTNVAAAMFENEGDIQLAVSAAIRTAISRWIPEIKVEDIILGEVTEMGALMVKVIILLPDYTSTSISVSSVVLNPNGSTTR